METKLMITKENFKEVIRNISKKDKKRILKSDKEYIVIELHCFNCGSRVDVKLTNNYDKYNTVSNNGNCILEIDKYLINMIKETLK